MHHALEIEEILFNIFSHCYSRADLSSLARTCRTFKEPALDVLWEELDDLVPLELCLPEPSPDDDKYSFSRPLTQNDWDTLQSYTRRIRRIEKFGRAFDESSIAVLSDPPTAGPLFPNLHYLYCKDIVSAPLLRLPFPSLVSLDLRLHDSPCLQDSLKSFSECSPNITSLSIYVSHPSVTFNTLICNCICQWRNLEKVDLPQISLDVEALAYLSHIPTLIELGFKQPVMLPDYASPLLFSNLHDLSLYPASLSPISQLLSRIQLPATKFLSVLVYSCPSKQELSSCLASVQTANPGHTIERFWLSEMSSGGDVRSEAILCLANLRPCMAFSNLREIDIRVGWSVGLTESELLSLASGWPNLERLLMNLHWGWNTHGGITPKGLLQLLQERPSLHQICLAVDTRGYTELPPANLGLALRLRRHFDVLDSIIEAESVPAITAFFAGIAASCSRFSVKAWSGVYLVKPPGWEVYNERWKDVGKRIEDATLGSCSLPL